MGVFNRRVERDENNNYMPGTYREARPLTAAAAKVDLSSKTQIESLRRRRQGDAWQTEAWEYYDLVGELKFSANLIAAVTSRVRLYPGYISDDSLIPADLRKIDVEGIDDDIKKAANQALRLLDTGNGGIGGLLKDAALNMFVAGECYLVQQPKTFSQAEQWQVRSVDEIVASGDTKNSGLFIKPRRNARKEDLIKLPKSAFMGRIWNTHPRYSDEADSSVRGVLELLDELLLLNKSSRKTLKSRLNAGLLYIPDEMSNVSQSDGDVDDSTDSYAEDSDDNSDSFEEEFIAAATNPIADEGSASAVVPLIVRGPKELGEYIKHITFDQTFDPQHVEREKRVMDRILAALDLPKDIVAGIGDSKYANAMVIEEAMYKSHVEPLILLLVDALTVVFYRPVLLAMGYPQEIVSNMVIWYDPSAITTKPSKAEAATIGYDKMLLSGEAWRKHTGFQETDKPDNLEIAQRIAIDRGLISEPVMEALLRALIPEIMDKVRQEQAQNNPAATDLQDAIENNAPDSENSEENEAPAPPEDLLEP